MKSRETIPREPFHCSESQSSSPLSDCLDIEWGTREQFTNCALTSRMADLQHEGMDLLKPQQFIRVLLADDHEILRLGTASFLRLKLKCEICAVAANGRDALKLAESTRPDVAVIDLALPGLNGLDVTRQIRRLLPDTEVVILTGDASTDLTERAFEAGAKAFILKVDAVLHLAEAVQMAGEHRFYLTPKAHESLQLKKTTKSVARKTQTAKNLTDRERDVIQLLAEGKSNKEVGGSLGISVKTVETHRAAIMRKLKLTRLSDLVRYAIHNKIISA